MLFCGRHQWNATVCILAVVLSNCAGLLADDRAGLEHFETHVRPVLIERCQTCHGPDKQEGGLRLDSREGWIKGGDRGPAVVPGDLDKSSLIQAIRYSDPDFQMPPKNKLRPTEIAAIEKWVLSGAVDPRVATKAISKHVVADPKTFWSFQPVRRPAPPSTGQSDRVLNPVDAFLMAQLNAKGLSPAPRADARTLVRRAYFDLIGLPPTSDQVDLFSSDPSEIAWARLIDQLLESKQYGERWGRHWLDVVRYADSGGFETDVYYRNAWRYRDYVVKSFNDDKPYDIFVQEQIAGDEMWPDDLALNGNYTIAPEKLRHFEALTGTGLYTLGPQIHESNMDGKKIRYETISDWVDTTGAAFMGLTFGCARCHDHKFDPLTQRDYYAMQAIFSGSREIEVPVVDGMGIADFKQHYPRVIAVDEARRAIRLFDAKMAGKTLSAEDKAERQQLMNRLAESVLAVPDKNAQGIPFAGLMEIPTISVLGHERPELIPTTYLLNRGELTRPREPIGPGLPESLQQQSLWKEAQPGTIGGRTVLAKWLTSPTHPLTARVMVNRIWYGHFGRGIVSSLNDFGQMGERPTHPELLDWLASEFVRLGWSVKQMHRTIMQSSAYRMDSRWQNEQNSQIDPTNHSLWKMNRRRLEAEVLWDSIHSVAGTLNLKMGGRPSIPPLASDESPPANWTVSVDPAEQTRRGLYILQRRNFRFPMFDVFDLPVNSVSAPSREVTSVAPQALWMMNNSTVIKQATALAARVRGSGTTSWNQPDFGPGQPGWIGEKSGAHAGWARRVDNGNPTDTYDDPVGTVITHGFTSVAWRVPSGSEGDTQIQGGLWNIRHIGRSGEWKLWHNSRLVSEGKIDDQAGTSANPLGLNMGTGGNAALKLKTQAGDLLRLEILEGDFVGVQLRVSSPKGTRDLSTDFSLEANPTVTGWQYSEAVSNGGGPLTQSVTGQAEDDLNRLVERAWRLGLGRAPSTEEKSEAAALLKTLAPDKPSSALTQLCLAIFNLQEFSYVD